MANKVYIVTSGCYSDYGIRAVFLDKQKAELFCMTHRYGYDDDCIIEEWDLSDDKLYTPKKSVEAWLENRNGKKRIGFKYYTTALEDDLHFYKNDCCLSVWGSDWYHIHLRRKLPNDYEEWEIEEKYERVMYDISAEVMNMMAELQAARYEERDKMFKLIEEAISTKYGYEVE